LNRDVDEFFGLWRTRKILEILPQSHFYKASVYSQSKRWDQSRLPPTLRQKAYPPDEFIDVDELVICIDFTHPLARKEGT